MAYTLIRTTERGEHRLEGLTKARARMFAHQFLVDNGCGTRSEMAALANRAASSESVTVVHSRSGCSYTVQVIKE